MILKFNRQVLMQQCDRDDQTVRYLVCDIPTFVGHFALVHGCVQLSVTRQVNSLQQLLYFHDHLQYNILFFILSH